MVIESKPEWSVKYDVEARATLDSGVLSSEDLSTIRLWERTVRDGGPEALLEDPSVWADHPLTGFWNGCRASSFSFAGRIIYYAVIEPMKIVLVMRITPDHDYSPKE